MKQEKKNIRRIVFKVGSYGHTIEILIPPKVNAAQLEVMRTNELTLKKLNMFKTTTEDYYEVQSICLLRHFCVFNF